MSSTFSSKQGPIYVGAVVSGPAGRASLRLILDAGATTTLIVPDSLIGIGYDPASSTDLARVAMGGGTATVPRITLNRLSTLGLHRIGFREVSCPLPAEANVDGLPGLDFFRDQILTLDFRSGTISLA